MISVTVIFTMAVFLFSPAKYSSAVRDGISLWAVSVLPATFPFLFLTALLSHLPVYRFTAKLLSPVMKELFRVSGEGGCLAVMSALSGYPVGAKLVSVYSTDCAPSLHERFRLACLCSTSGPMFLVGVVGSGMFRNGICGWILLLSHLIGVYAVCFFLRFGKKRPQSTCTVETRSNENVLYESLYQAVISVLCVGGFIAVFYVFGQMLSDLSFFSALSKLLPFFPAETAEAFLRGLLEMTAGCALLAKDANALTLALSCFLTTFGGACVLMQQLAYLSKTGISAMKFIAVKVLQAFLSACICYALALTCGI